MEEMYEKVECNVSPDLALQIKPYFGDPRGSKGPRGMMENESFAQLALKILQESRKYKIKTREDEWFCICRWDFDSLYHIIESIVEDEARS